MLRYKMFKVKVFNGPYLHNPFMDIFILSQVLGNDLKFYTVPASLSSISFGPRSWACKFYIKIGDFLG